MTISKKSVLSVSLFVLLLWGVVLSTFATPPLSPYTVTDNATDPTCAPGSANCYVSSVTADNGLTAVGSNVRLGGTLVQNTTIDTANREFSIKNGEMSFVSGADPLGLTAEVGAPVPGMGFVSDGVSTNGLQSWIFSGKLPNSQGNQLLNVFGNFDLASNKQGGIIVQDLETNLYNSDQFNSSGINIRPTEIGMYTRGRINFSAEHGLSLASNTGYLQFSNYYAGRDDTTTGSYYVLGVTERGTNFGSVGAANFSGSYSGTSAETYRINIDIAPGSTWTLGPTRNDNNFGSPNNVVFGGTYSGSNFDDYYYLNIESGGTTFNWSDGSGNNGSGVPIVAGTPIALSQGVTVTFGSASYVANEQWAAQIDYQGTPSTTFSWNDGSGGSGSGVAIPAGGGSVFLSQGVSVEFSTGTFISGDEWHMTTEARGVPAGANNFLYTDGSGYLRQAPTSLLSGGSFSLASQDEGSTLTSTTTGYNFIGAGVTATESGGVVTVNIPGGGGDGSIYLNDGTLTAGRIVDLGTHTLNFQNGEFSVGANSSVSIPLSLNGTSTASNNEGVFIGGTNNALTASAVGIFGNNSSTGSDIQIFPFNQKFKILNLVTDNTADQVLAKDGLGNSVWRDVSSLSGGGGTNIYNSDGTLTGNRILNGGGNDLTFNSLNNFTLASSGTISSSTISGSDSAINLMAPGVAALAAGKTDSGKVYNGGLSLIPGIGIGGGSTTRLYENNTTDGFYSSVVIDAEGGIGFDFDNNSSLNTYNFPRADGTASQVLTTDGAGQLSWQNAGTFSLSSQDEGSVLTTTTNTYNFTGAGVTATNSGSVVTVNIPNNSTNIYNSSGTLTSNRTVSGSNNTLDFFSMGGFSVGTSAPSNISTALGLTPGGATFQFMNNNTSTGGGLILNPTSGLLLSEEDNGVTGGTSSLRVKGDTGITFEFNDQAGDGSYLFPRNIGANGQVLMTNGAGQLSWQTTGTNLWSLVGNSGTTAGTNFIGTTDPEDFVIKVNNIEVGRFYEDTGTSSQSIALGGGSNALSANMFVAGVSAGQNATNAQGSNFIGQWAGQNAINSSNSNFIGSFAGNGAVGVTASNFIGGNAGLNATGVTNSNFFGSLAGSGTSVSSSNFLGPYAGQNATNADGSNFLGYGAGVNATSASNSNFFGHYAGETATNASFSSFIGYEAGVQAANASNSIFIGTDAGMLDTVDNTTNVNDFSILLGNHTSTGGFENSIALGQRATNTASNQFMIGSTTRPIDQTKIIGSLGTECTITTGTGMACTSDERLKTNITDLTSDTLSKLQNVRTVSYNWLQNPNSPLQIGFLAQNLEQYFPEMVMTDATGKKQVYYSQMTPILVEAIREMNLKIIDLSDMAKENTWRDALVAWFESSTNGIQKIFTKEVQTDKLCVGQTCVTESQLQQLLQAQNIQNTPQPTSPNPTTPDPLACTAPQVLNQTGDACVDPEPVPVSEETPPTDTPPTEEPPTVTE